MNDGTKRPDTTSRDATPEAAAPEPVVFGDVSAHLAFQQEIAAMLAEADITEEQRQQFLIAASCTCCGAGGLSLSLSLKPDTNPKF